MVSGEFGKEAGFWFTRGNADVGPSEAGAYTRWGI